MTSSIPEPLRAVAGLAAVAIDETRGLPRKLTSLPVVVLGAAMQASLRVRQSYAGLVARGDELLTQLGAGADEPPSWARFDDEDEPAGPPTEAADRSFAEPGEDPLAEPFAESVGGRNGSSAEEPVGNRRSRFDAQPDVDAFPAAPVPAADVAPVAGYDGFSLAQLRARLRRYDAETLRRLVDYERAGAARPAYLTMLENRLATLDRS